LKKEGSAGKKEKGIGGGVYGKKIDESRFLIGNKMSLKKKKKKKKRVA